MPVNSSKVISSPILSSGIISNPVVVDGVAVAGGFDFSSLFSSGEIGFVVHGKQSGFYTGSNLTTECSSSGSDPVGSISDISGTGIYYTQSKSADKPVYYSDGTVKSWRMGTIATATRGFAFSSALNSPTGAFTRIMVGRGVSAVNNQCQVITNFTGAWTGGYSGFSLKLTNPNESKTRFANSTTATFTDNIVSSSDKTTPFICNAGRSGTGANQAWNDTYDLTGSVINTATGTQNLSTAVALNGGSPNAGSVDVGEFCFVMQIDRELTAQEWTDVLADLVENFGSWT